MFIGIPTRGVIFTQTLKSLSDNLINQNYKIYLTQISPVDKARNDIIRSFLESKDDYLFMLDDDEVMPKNALEAMLGANKDIVVIDAPAKKTFKSNIFKNKDGSIEASGFGCALFKRKVFETLPTWFDLSPRRKMEYDGKYTFPIIDDAKPNDWGGEDVNFSLKLKEYGFDIYQLEGFVCKHLEYEPFNNDKRAVKILEIKSYDEIK